MTHDALTANEQSQAVDWHRGAPPFGGLWVCPDCDRTRNYEQKGNTAQIRCETCKTEFGDAQWLLSSRIEQTHAVEREAAVPGGAFEFSTEQLRKVDDALHDFARAAIATQKITDHSEAWKALRACTRAIEGVLTPALRPPQPGVVTEELRKLSEQATQGRMTFTIVPERYPECDDADLPGYLGINGTYVALVFEKYGDCLNYEANGALLAGCWNFVRDLLAAPSPGASVTASPAPSPAPDAGLASGCCSASTPCDHQKVSPYTLCDTCQKAAAGPLSYEWRAEKASAFLASYADGTGDKLLGGYCVHSIARKLAAALLEAQQAALPTAETAPDAGLVEALKTTTVHLVAAISILSRAHSLKKPPAQVAPSNKMFRQMLKDYERAADVGRAALSRAALETAPDAGLVADQVCRDVSELPDRTSPEDWPEAMLVTADELHRIIRAALSRAGERP